LLAENTALRVEMATLRLQLAELTQQLQAASVRIAELEQDKTEPPPLVKPNRRIPLSHGDCSPFHRGVVYSPP
jgi:hypothetical protein